MPGWLFGSHLYMILMLVLSLLRWCLDFLLSINPRHGSCWVTLGFCVVSFAEGASGDLVFDATWTSRFLQGWTFPVCSSLSNQVCSAPLDCGFPACLVTDWTLDFGNSYQNRPYHSRSPVWLIENFQRFGEASNPGPPLAISCINPSGLAGKVTQALDLPRGIVNVSETHLSAVSMPYTIQQLRSQASASHRQLWISPGAAVSVRPRSESVGTWSGVLQFADVRCHPLSLCLGRMMSTVLAGCMCLSLFLGTPL